MWNRYVAAFEDALTRCNTDCAPWHVIPANRKWYRNLVVSEVLIQTMENTGLRFPDPVADIESNVIPE